MPGFRDVLDKLDPIAFWLLRVFGTAGALALAYLVLVMFSGNLGKPMADLDPEHKTLALQILKNLKTTCTVLNWALIVCAVSSIIVAFDEATVTFVVAAVGVGIYFGLQFLLKPLIGNVDAIAVIITTLRPAGYTLTFLGGAKYALDALLWIISLPDRVRQRADVGVGKQAEPAQQKIARDANMFSPCWKLPFCREVIRKQCPAFLAKRTCWKFGRGCYCDEEMISRIIRGESMDVIKAPTRMSREGKAPCGRCYIYLEHQTHKFRMMSPLALPATILICFVGAPLYAALFERFSGTIDSFFGAISFDPHNLTPKAVATDPNNVKDVTSLQPHQVTAVAEWMFGFIIGIMLLVYISKFIEWAIYKAKL